MLLGLWLFCIAANVRFSYASWALMVAIVDTVVVAAADADVTVYK